jgi:hypothetical protein
MTKDAEIFTKAYAELNNALAILRSAKDEDSDTLFACVETAANAKVICHERLAEVKKLLDEKISTANK